MEYLVSGAQMKEYDSGTIEKTGIPSLVLMERAAYATAEEIQKRFRKEKNMLVIAGCGNNGGDGFAVGRILQEYGYEVDYVLIGSREKCSAETEKQIQILENMGMTIGQTLPETPYDVIVDALFGIGLSREVTGNYLEAIRYMNEAKSYVVSADIPSGIHADTGAVMGEAVKADLTVTYGYRKLGLVFYPGADYAGELICRKIGIFWQKSMTKPAAITYDKTDLAGIPARRNDGNKGSFGKVLVIAGNYRMYGACQFAALGAYRSGAGLVRIVTAQENRELLMQTIPEAIVDTYERQTPDTELEELLKEAMNWADCVLIGPGIGQEKQAVSIMKYVWENCSLPLVVDADGLNILSEHETWLMGDDGEGRFRGAAKNAPFVCFTPHMGEFSRLTKKSIKCCKEEIIVNAKEYAKRCHVIVAAKDARTVVADPEGSIYINTSGDNGMATGGSGDVLTGILAGLIAQGMQGMEAVCMAVYLHGLAGNAASQKKTVYSVMAGDLLEELPALFAEGGMDK